MSSLADKVRARAAEVHAGALEIIERELYVAAGPALPDGIINTSSLPGLLLVEGSVVIDNATATTVWEWTVGEPSMPYDPHQALNGATFSEADWREVLASAGEFGSPYYFPQDHQGCQCEVTNVVGEVVFEPSALDARPVTLKAFGQTILVTPSALERTEAAPSWWTETLTAERWGAALVSAAG